MHPRTLLLLALVLVATVAILPVSLAAPFPSPSPAPKRRRVNVGRPGNSNQEVDADAGSPSVFLDYEPATMSENSTTFTGMWVPNASSGGCLMWSTDRVTPLAFWKPACDAPKLRTWVIGVLGGTTALLVLCAGCYIYLVKRTGAGILALLTRLKRGQGFEPLKATSSAPPIVEPTGPPLQSLSATETCQPEAGPAVPVAPPAAYPPER